MNEHELNLPPEKRNHNAVTGCFLRGSTPWNKGKKWDEYLSKRKQKRCARGWKNLRLFAPRAPNAGKNKKAVIGILDDGTWAYFSFLGEAAEKLGISRENIGRCCRENEKGETKKFKKPNTDHKYKNIRWYFETDNKWTTKIKKQ